jgi:hypothetical protein
MSIVHGLISSLVVDVQTKMPINPILDVVSGDVILWWEPSSVPLAARKMTLVCASTDPGTIVTVLLR